MPDQTNSMVEALAPQNPLFSKQLSQGFLSGASNVLGIDDAVRALRGQMTPEEAQMFALGALPGMIPGARGEQAGISTVSKFLSKFPDTQKLIDDAGFKLIPTNWAGDFYLGHPAWKGAGNLAELTQHEGGKYHVAFPNGGGGVFPTFHDAVSNALKASQQAINLQDSPFAGQTTEDIYTQLKKHSPDKDAPFGEVKFGNIGDIEKMGAIDIMHPKYPQNPQPLGLISKEGNDYIVHLNKQFGSDPSKFASLNEAKAHAQSKFNDLTQSKFNDLMNDNEAWIKGLGNYDTDQLIEKALKANPGASIGDIPANPWVSTPVGKQILGGGGEIFPEEMFKSLPSKAPFEPSEKAKAAGYTIPLIHGTRTSNPFEEFKLPDELPVEEGKAYEIGVHAGSPRAAARFSGYSLANQSSTLPRNYPLVMKAQNPLELPDTGTWTPSKVANALLSYHPDKFSRDEVKTALGYDPALEYAKHSSEKYMANIALRQLLKSKGYDSIKYVNKVEDPGHMSYIALDPSQFRSPWAAFQDLNSRNLLSGLAGGGLLAGGLSHKDAIDALIGNK